MVLPECGQQGPGPLRLLKNTLATELQTLPSQAFQPQMVFAYPNYPLGIGATFSIGTKSKNPEGAVEVLDYVFTEQFYTDINNRWLGVWNIPLRSLDNIKLNDTVLPEYTRALNDLAHAVDENLYGYTTWTFMPPATNSYLVNGIEQVWFDAITPEEFLAKLDVTFEKEYASGKVASVPAR